MKTRFSQISLSGLFMLVAIPLPLAAKDVTPTFRVFETASSIMNRLSDQAKTNNIVITDKRGGAIKISDYATIRKLCEVNAMTRVRNRDEVVIDWHCGRYGETKPSDVLTIGTDSRVTLVADAPIVSLRGS